MFCFHCKESGVPGKVITAIDINTIANSVYAHNFPSITINNNNIQKLSADNIKQLNINTILMSPPCQPFTRVGLQKDDKDSRTDALLYICNELLKQLDSVKYLLLENVKGFETSRTRNLFIECLKKCGFFYQEFLLNPNQLGIPNTRLRYYCVARKTNKFQFSIDNQILMELPNISEFEQHKNNSNISVKIIKDYLLKENNDDNLLREYVVPDNILTKRANQFDIVFSNSNNSNCFTKAYTHYAKGTGSIFCPQTIELLTETYNKINTMDNSSEEYLKLLQQLNLRYFRPIEIANLMCFPNDTFSFPSNVTKSQQYRLLGNSINVKLVSELIKLFHS